MGFAKTGGSLFVAVVAIWYAVHKIMYGNPTQEIWRIGNLLSGGMTGDENVSAFDKFSKPGENATRDAEMAKSFYNLATEFYEYGWGDSFHFGFRRRSEPHWKCIDNSQTFVSQKLQVGNMDRVLDMGCGIGGPLRGVVRRTGANVTGLTINAHQVKRAKEITSRLSPWMQERCHYSVQDYLNVKGFEENAYDAAFYMESSLHCENRTKTFSETFRLLKPGGRLVAMEYVTLPAWDETDPEHAELMKWHLHGNGAAKTPTIAEDLEMIRAAGFEVKEHFNFMDWGKKRYGDQSWEWWADLQWNWWPHLLTAHPLVRWTLPKLLTPFAAIGIIPADVPAAAALMNEGGDGLSGLGKLKAITPQYYVLGIKPSEA